MKSLGSIVSASDVSDGWLQMIDIALSAPQYQLLHSVVRMANPTAEDPHVRTAVDEMLSARKLAPVETVANTIFPASLAARCKDAEELSDRYRRIYARLRKESTKNRSGTYFGRLVEYPGLEGKGQLPRLIKLLSREVKKQRRVALYEMAPSSPVVDFEPVVENGSAEYEAVLSEPVSVYAPEKDGLPFGFPCLTQLSFQLDGDRLHGLALYRGQYLVERAYGNYLGIGRLLDYIASSSGLKCGQLTVMVGYAQVENGCVIHARNAVKRVRQLALL
ncbi:hypothetical protein [Lentzea flaviverrucosa]|uniref:Thymidylate synthase n=1 Tax=Lentzea flaviverrucosa TaxID=200379 RepID=A0A1H9XYR0_9PSEU|nr:hypothetical protein [Lentzea flaviverrucosa]RDI16347.1 hypothetical protein DFR72_1263 [Lentzea flaviverrucosa]SES51241.1 hypothetical protein SAMN05216195_1303 [Lentzea flaviverrucosa]